MSQTSHTISYRLHHYDYQQALKSARKARCKSVHEYARMAMLSVLEDEGADLAQVAQDVAQLRRESALLHQDLSQLRLTLAKTLQVLLNLNGYDPVEAERFVRHHLLDKEG